MRRRGIGFASRTTWLICTLLLAAVLVTAVIVLDLLVTLPVAPRPVITGVPTSPATSSRTMTAR
jgi:hypothetical protein